MSEPTYLIITLDVEEEGLFSGSYRRSGSGVANVAELKRLEFIALGFRLALNTSGDLPGGPGPGRPGGAGCLAAGAGARKSACTCTPGIPRPSPSFLTRSPYPRSKPPAGPGGGQAQDPGGLPHRKLSGAAPLLPHGPLRLDPGSPGASARVWPQGGQQHGAPDLQRGGPAKFPGPGGSLLGR